MSMPKMTLQAPSSEQKKKWLATGRLCQRRLERRIFEQIVVFLVLSVLASCSPTRGEGRGTHAVLRMSGCTLYSFAKTKGTMPWGRAACSFRHFAKQENKQAEHGEKKKAKLLCWPPRRREREGKRRAREGTGKRNSTARMPGCWPRAGGSKRLLPPLRVYPSPPPFSPPKVPGRWRRAEACPGGPRRRTRPPSRPARSGSARPWRTSPPCSRTR